MNPGDTIHEVFEVPSSAPTLPGTILFTRMLVPAAVVLAPPAPQDDETSRVLDVLGRSVATMCVSDAFLLIHRLTYRNLFEVCDGCGKGSSNAV